MVSLPHGTEERSKKCGAEQPVVEDDDDDLCLRCFIVTDRKSE